MAALLMAICVSGLLANPLSAYPQEEMRNAEGESAPLMNVAYVTSESKCLPDPKLMTNIFYAFAEVSEDFKGVDIMNPERFSEVLALKKVNPDLKISLSIGGYRKAGFSEACGSKKNRKAFVADIKRKVEQYGLDGVDLDWEFPTTSDGGHTSSPDDDLNYARLVKELRKVLGKDKLITFYSNNSGLYMNFPLMMPYVDYVMVSGYNIAMPPNHQSNLYNSARFTGWSVDKAVEEHHKKGVPYSKMLLGIPFFARTSKMHLRSGSEFTYLDRYLYPEYLSKYRPRWDNKAKAAYMTDSVGNVAVTYDTPQSISEKAAYARQKGLGGGFYWHYCSENDSHGMAKSMRDNFMKSK